MRQTRMTGFDSRGAVFRRMSPPLHLFTLRSLLKSHLSSFLSQFSIVFHLFSARAVTCHFGHYNRFYICCFAIFTDHFSARKTGRLEPPEKLSQFSRNGFT